MKKYLLIITLISSSVFAQNSLDEANKLLSNEDWNGAEKAYLKYLKKNDTDSMAWFNLAKSQMSQGKFKESIKNFEKAKDGKLNAFLVDFNVSKVYALNGESENMYTTLERLAENGLFAFTQLQTHDEFESHRSTDRFQKILKKVELNAYPCLNNEVSRHLDFWIGEWDVYARGGKVGENSITRAPGGCAIHESYTTAGNYSGQSINFFSPVDQKWHQHWVGSSGDVYNYVETKREEGLLQFVSEYASGQGQTALSRLTFTANDDGTVRQLMESSSDDGETWAIAFDGLYKKKN